LAIVRGLRAANTPVRSFSRQHYPELDALGVEQAKGDLTDATAVRQAMADCTVVFHVAAKAGVWGRYADYAGPNLVGTQHILSACRTHGVRKLVFTSTPSVVYAGGHLEGVDESIPYPRRYETPYAETKAAAERLVLAANGPELATVALRPHLIWGPGDPHLIPRLLARARSGRLRIVGAGTNIVDCTYVDNAAQAHLLAAAALAPGSACAGKAYFITNNEPEPLWPFLNRILALAGIPPVTRRVPYALAYAGGAMLEAWYRLRGLTDEPPMTRFVARQLATHHWFNTSAARRDFGYTATVSLDDGLTRWAADWRR
jgi:nucleoside-diphosphate-sugar epimerase